MARRGHRRAVVGALLALALTAGCSPGDATGSSAPTTVPAAPAPTSGTATTDRAGTDANPAPTPTPSTETSPRSTVPGPARVANTMTSIVVASNTEQYFVLYVKPDLNAATEVPVAIAKGEANRTTLTDGRRALPDEHYRVATFSVRAPGDVDGDGIDDLTELADPLGNPLNPAPKLDARAGAVIVPSVDVFADLSYQGNNVGRDTYLAGAEFMKFWIVGTNTAHPAVYFMNTNTYNAHPTFAAAVGIPGGRGPTAGNMRGDIVFEPDGVAPDGSKGTYRFAFQPNDAYSFPEIALAYELLVTSMPMLDDNLSYYPFPQSALPLYRKEQARYDAYRVPVVVP